LLDGCFETRRAEFFRSRPINDDEKRLGVCHSAGIQLRIDGWLMCTSLYLGIIMIHESMNQALIGGNAKKYYCLFPAEGDVAVQAWGWFSFEYDDCPFQKFRRCSSK